MIQVLIADDHPVVRAGYQRLLEQDGGIQVVHEAGDMAEALAGWIEHSPDVLVTDLSMPGDGLNLVRRVLQHSPGARVLVFSMHDSPLLVRRAFDAGAQGYVTKASPPERLVEAVYRLHAGHSYLSDDLPASLLQHQTAGAVDPLACLSEREYEVFRLLARGLSAAECAAALQLSPKTVSNHQSSIRDKLGVSTSAAMALLAVSLGMSAGPEGAPPAELVGSQPQP